MDKKYSDIIAEEFKKAVMNLEIKAISENGTFKVVASDETVDRAGETIRVSGWDLTNYKNNPIILFWHDYRSIDTVIGKATNVYVEGTSLIVEGVFASTEKAQIVRKLYDEGIMKTVSVGFIPKERDAKDHSVITKAELLELSFVPVPANPNALSLQKEMLDKGIEFGIFTNEEKAISSAESLDRQMMNLIKAEMWIVDGDSDLRMYLVAIFVSEFIYNIYGEIEAPDWTESYTDKYFRREYTINGEAVELVGESVEVKPQTEWVDQMKSLKVDQYAELKEMINAIPAKIKEVSEPKGDADMDNGKSTEDKLQDAKVKMQKMSSILSEALHEIKI